MTNIYCGTKPLKKNQKYGTMTECAEKKEIRRFGLYKVDPRALRVRKIKKVHELSREQLILKQVSLRGKINKLSKALKNKEITQIEHDNQVSKLRNELNMLNQEGRRRVEPEVEQPKAKKVNPHKEISMNIIKNYESIKEKEAQLYKKNKQIIREAKKNINKATSQKNARLLDQILKKVEQSKQLEDEQNKMFKQVIELARPKKKTEKLVKEVLQKMEIIDDENESLNEAYLSSLKLFNNYFDYSVHPEDLITSLPKNKLNNIIHKSLILDKDYLKSLKILNNNIDVTKRHHPNDKILKYIPKIREFTEIGGMINIISKMLRKKEFSNIKNELKLKNQELRKLYKKYESKIPVRIGNTRNTLIILWPKDPDIITEALK